MPLTLPHQKDEKGHVPDTTNCHRLGADEGKLEYT